MARKQTKAPRATDHMYDQQPTHNERIKSLIDRLTEGVAAIQTSDDFTRYLKAAARFHSYSAHNIMLIVMQCPAATRVAGYKTWLSLGRYARKGEKGITIFAPMPYHVNRINNETGEAEERAGINFRLVSFFDIGQTEGEPLPEPARPTILTGDEGASLYHVYGNVAQAQGLTLTTTDPDDPNNPRNGCYWPSRRLIYVRPNPPSQMLKTLLHELTHHFDPGLNSCPIPEQETVAEAAAFVVAAHYGIDTSAYTFPYIAGWAGADDGATIIRHVMQRTQHIVAQLIRLADVQCQPEQAAPNNVLNPTAFSVPINETP